MDWSYKAMLTAVTVAAVLMAAQFFGRRLAGLLAGLPVIAAPALLWIASEHGASYAARCAVGSICACGAAAVFALAYERLARRGGPLASLAGALAAGGIVALALAAAAVTVASALAATGALCALAVLRLPVAPAAARPAQRLRHETILTAVTAGVASATITLLSTQFGEFWSGLLASMPVISASALVHQHLTTTHADRQRFLRGYASGLIGKAAFAATFALAAPSRGALPAMGAAVAVGLSVAMVATRAARQAEASRQTGLQPQAQQ